MAKHYIRLDNENYIIHAYSDEFENYQAGDICINEFGTRAVNLQTHDFTTGQLRLKYEDGKIIESIRPKVITESDINIQVVSKIREKYDINKEFQMHRQGMLNSEDKEYLDYLTHVKTCVELGEAEKAKLQ